MPSNEFQQFFDRLVARDLDAAEMALAAWVRAKKKPIGPVAEKVVEYPPGFTAFWNFYPRRIAKGEAFKAWQALTRPDKEAAIDRAQWVAGCWKALDPHGDRLAFCPHPATWLRARGWEDDDGAVELAARGK